MQEPTESTEPTPGQAGVKPLVVAVDMGRKQIKGGSGVLMALVAFAASVFIKLNAAWILLGAALWSFGTSYYRKRCR